MKKFTFYDSVRNRVRRFGQWWLPCLILFLAGQTDLFAQVPPAYCVPVFPSGCATENIDDFILQNTGIYHIDSGCSVNTYTYGDFTGIADLQGTLRQGETYQFTVVSAQFQMLTRIWIDFDGDGDFEDEGELLFSSTAPSVTTTGTITIPSTAPLTDSTRLRVMSKYNALPTDSCTSGGGYGETHDYTVEILPPPDCSTPQSLAVDEVTFTSANLSWVSDETAFEIEYGQSGFTLGDGVETITGIETTSYELEDLEPEMSYQFYVRQDCNDTENGYSIWVGPYTFYTGYCLVSSTGTNYRITGFSTSEGYTNILNLNNGIDNVYNNFSDYVVTQLAGGSFDYGISVPANTNVEIWVDWNNDFLFEEDELVAAHEFNWNDITFTGTITIPEDIPDGDYRIRVRSRLYVGTVAAPCGPSSHGETEDYTLSIIPVPDCLPPSGLTVDDVTYTSADVSWVSEGTLFNVLVGAPGFTPSDETGTLHEGVPNFYTIEGLDPETHYHYYVQRDCSDTEEGESYWAGPYPFYTGYCQVSLSVTNAQPFYRITGFSTSEGYFNILNQNNGIDNVYNNFTNYVVTQSAGGSFDYGISVPGYTNVGIWVDWNNDFIFEEAELVAEHIYGTVDTIFTGTITIPEGIPDGDYRIRVRSRSFSSTVAAPCGPSSYGETEDYTLSIIPVPDCLPPSGLTVDDVTFTSADVSWVSEGTLFNVWIGTPGFTPGDEAGVLHEGVPNFYTIEGLDQETHYHYYVQRDCSDTEDGESYWAGPYPFYTGYCLVSSTGTGNRILGFTTSEGYVNIFNPENGTDNSYNNFSYYSVPHSEGETFEYTVTVPADTNVEIWVDWNNNMIFDEDELVAEELDPFTDEGTFTGTITIPEGTPDGDYRMRVRSRYYYNTVATPCGPLPSGETEDYTISVAPVPDCLPPSDLAVDGGTFASADVSWVSDGELFNVLVGAPGFTPSDETGTLHEGVSNYYTIEGLDPETYYHYYVQRDCSDTEDGESYWAGPYPFYTDYCLAFSTGTTGYRILGFTTSEGYTNIFNSDNGVANSYNNYSNYNVTDSEGGYFEYAVTVPGNTNVELWVDWNSNMIFDEDELVGEHIYEVSTTTFTGTITIPEGTPEGDYRLRVRSRFYWQTEATPCGPLPSGETEDYTISVVPVPDCLLPSGLTVDNVTFTSADISWVSDGTLFNVLVGVPGFTPSDETGTLHEGVYNYYTIEGLDPETHYHYYVQRDCSGTEDGESYWTGPYPFYTGYCLASTAYPNSNQITSFTTTGGILFDISNASGTSLNGTGYNNYSSQSVHHFETGAIDFTVTISGECELGIWIDWNNDMVFDMSEKVYTSLVSANFFSGTILVPLGTPVGDYRMRVRSQWNSSSSLACGEINHGEAEDYTFTVITPPACLLPYIPTATNISVSSVLLGWQTDGDTFDIEYGYEGFTPGEGILIEGIGNPYVLEGLTPGTTYQYYVRQDCADDDYSIWNGPVTFTPGEYQGNIPTLFNENPDVDDYSCAYESISIEVPEGQELVSLNVQYTINSFNGAWISQQRSVLYSPTLNAGEADVAAGEEDYPGSITYNRTVEFANGATGTVEFVLKAWRTNHGTGCNSDYVYVMDGTWVLNPTFELIPTCPNPPTNLGYTNITEGSVDLIWQSEEGTLFEVWWGTLGFDPEDEEGTLISGITTTSYTLSGLDSSIAYEFYVRRDCSAGDEEDYGDWAGPFTFNSGYCLPTSQLTQYISAFSTGLAIENISYTSTAINPGGYGNKTDLVVSREPGESFTFSTNFIGGQNAVRIWVDWNHNFLFEENEEVFSGSNPGPGNLVTGSVAIPVDTEPGNYVMRVRTVYGASASPQPCGEVQYGEALDFTLHVACVIAAPAGEAAQVFTQGQTLVDLDITGVGLAWYADSELTDVLNETHELVHGVTYYVVSSNEYCQSEALAITVTDICFDFAAPAGEANQTFIQGQTLANVEVTGIGLTWYAEAALTTVLEESTELVHGATYYVISTNDNCVSTALAITVIDSCFGFAAPAGDTVQTFTPGQTLASLEVTGIGLTWYAEETLTTVLEDNTVLVHGATYYVISTNDNCISEALAITVTDSCFDFTAPAGETDQTFTSGQTLADLEVTGDGLTWYADENLTLVLEETEILVHQTTYYVISSNEYCQSEALAITVEEEVNTSGFDKYGFKYYPNPVSEVLYLVANTEITEVGLFNMLGQKLNIAVQPDNTQVDMSGLPSGNYFISITIEGINKVFKVVKH